MLHGVLELHSHRARNSDWSDTVLRLGSQVFSKSLTVLLDFITILLLFTASASRNSVSALMQIIVYTSVLHLLWQIALQWNISPDEA